MGTVSAPLVRWGGTGRQMAGKANRKAGPRACRGLPLVGPGVPKAPVPVIFGLNRVVSKRLLD